MELVRALPTALALLALAAPAAGAQDVRDKDDDSPLGTEVLSNETTLTRFAHAVSKSKIRSKPKSSGRTMGRLRYQTEDGFPEPYPVLRSHEDSAGRIWLQVRIPARPNNRKGWVPRASLSEFHIVETQLRINRKALQATLYKRGKKIWSSRVGIGKASSPTPAGRFVVRERLRALGGVYGPWAFGTSAYSKLSDWPGGGVVGVHGTNQPHLIPGRPSHGCVRVPNAKVRQLAKLMPVGTPIHVL